ncbi:hypothetical protein Tco_0250949 [Tanacetum coccineum]
MAFMSSSNNNTSSTNEAVNTAHGVSTASTQVNAANFINWKTELMLLLDGFEMANGHVDYEGKKVFENTEGSLLLMAMRLLVLISPKWSATTATRGDILLGSAELQEIKTTRTRKAQEGVPVETSTSIALVSCDGLGRYDWSDQAKEGPNYALMSYSSSSPDSEVSNDSICSKSCLKTIESLKSQNDQLLKDLKKYELMVLAYKTSLESVEEKLEVYKANESIYLQDIKGLKFEIHLGEIDIREIKKKLEIIVDNCKKDEFVNKPIVENYKAMSSGEEPKVVRKNDDAPIIEEWVSDDEKRM